MNRCLLDGAGSVKGSGVTKFRWLWVILAVVVIALLVAPMMRVSASEEEEEFDFHIGDRFLEKLVGAPQGDVARAANGDTIKIIGHGEFEVDEREAHGRGTFEHRTSTGALVASGTWKVQRLLVFDNFGSQSGLPENLRGGHAVFEIRVTAHPAGAPQTTIKLTATLVVDCALGNVPPGVDEGITVNVPGVINFNQMVSGFTVFVAEEED